MNADTSFYSGIPCQNCTIHHKQIEHPLVLIQPLQIMNATTQWSSQMQQSIMFKLNKNLSKLGCNAGLKHKTMYLSSFYNANSIVLSCNMPQFVTNHHTTQKDIEHLPPLCKGTT
jgi:hypothetical protein